MDILVLAGDGIDPEIKPAICASLTRPARAFGLDLRFLWLPIGLAVINHFDP
jgi:isocitrate/isopropylmalate dehydrogenase